MSIYGDILDAVVTVVQGLDLAGLDDVNIKKRGLPVAAETLDPLPCVLVCPSERGERSEPLSGEESSLRDKTIWVDVVAVAAKNSDFSLPDDVLTWRDAIDGAFQGFDLPGVARVFDMDLEFYAPLPRTRLNENYAYSGVSVGFHVVKAVA